MYPNDEQYEDKTITSVTPGPYSYTIMCDDGSSLWCGEYCPIEPTPGMSARFYVDRIGRRVRGLFINGTMIWYSRIDVSLRGPAVTDAEKIAELERRVAGLELTVALLRNPIRNNGDVPIVVENE